MQFAQWLSSTIFAGVMSNQQKETGSPSRARIRATGCGFSKLVARDARGFVAIPLRARDRRDEIARTAHNFVARGRVFFQERLQRWMPADVAAVLDDLRIARDVDRDLRIALLDVPEVAQHLHVEVVSS